MPSEKVSDGIGVFSDGIRMPSEKAGAVFYTYLQNGRSDFALENETPLDELPVAFIRSRPEAFSG